MHRVLVAVVAVVAALGCNCARAADLLSDAPEERYFEPTKVEFPPTYVDALRVWKTALEINQPKTGSWVVSSAHGGTDFQL